MSRSFLFFRWMHGIFVVAAILDLFFCSTQRQQTRPSVVSFFFGFAARGREMKIKTGTALSLAQPPSNPGDKHTTLFCVLLTFRREQPPPPTCPPASPSPSSTPRLRKFLETNALMRQAHMVAEGNPRVADHLKGLGQEVGGTVTLESFARLAVGERESPSASSSE